jgi:hypothetical protein
MVVEACWKVHAFPIEGCVAYTLEVLQLIHTLLLMAGLFEGRRIVRREELKGNLVIATCVREKCRSVHEELQVVREGAARKL